MPLFSSAEAVCVGVDDWRTSGDGRRAIDDEWETTGDDSIIVACVLFLPLCVGK